MHLQHPHSLIARRGNRLRGSLVAAGLALGSLVHGGHALAQSTPKPDWSLADMPAQNGRIYLVTGGTSGMGYEDAKALGAAGARVVIAARNPDRGEEAIARIRQAHPQAQVEFERVDLADLTSVRALSERLQARLPRLDGLINNAAIMSPPERRTSSDGFEAQLATNFLGHFALTAQLLPLLRKSEDPRVVSLSSIAVARGAIHFEDLQSSTTYDPFTAYAQSKLACLMFAFELQRRSDAGGWGLRSIAAHPGVAVTELIARGPGLDSEFGRDWALDREDYHSAAQGALPTLYAATAPQAEAGRYYGPVGPEQKRGPLGLATVPAAATDAAAAARLWTTAETLTGVRFP